MTILPLLLAARTLVVAPGGDDAAPGDALHPFRTVAHAAEVAGPGDTVLVRDGLYREAVRLSRSGTPKAPIRFVAEHPGKATITGADPLAGWRRLEGDVYEADWNPVFAIDQRDGKPVETHPEDAPLWGRAEQVVADGRQLTPTLGLAGLQAARETLPQAAAGWFAVDTTAHRMRVRLADGSDPNAHRMEAATRGQIFGVNPWERPEGVHDVRVEGLRFRYGASFPQRGAVWLHGRDNLVQDCVVEEMAGTGIVVSGTLRRTVVKGCGHTGGAAMGDGFLNEACAWTGNCWKPIDRGWDAGGVKITESKNGAFRRCLFRDNGGPGLWLDVWDHDVTVSECVFERNEGSGLFIEICHRIGVDRCLARENGIRSKDWGEGGVKIGESMDVSVTRTTCMDNRDGIVLREQGPRPNVTDLGPMDFHVARVTLRDNRLDANREHGLGLWYDNGFFGRHPGDQARFPTEEAYVASLDPAKVYDPTRQSLTIDGNVYRGAVAQYGATWRPRSVAYADLAAFRERTGFEAHGRMGDGKAGWQGAPKDATAWMRRMLPAWMAF